MKAKRTVATVEVVLTLEQPGGKAARRVVLRGTKMVSSSGGEAAPVAVAALRAVTDSMQDAAWQVSQTWA